MIMEKSHKKGIIALEEVITITNKFANLFATFMVV